MGEFGVDTQNVAFHIKDQECTESRDMRGLLQLLTAAWLDSKVNQDYGESGVWHNAKMPVGVQMYNAEQKSSSVQKYSHANSRKYQLIFKGKYQ